MRYENPLYMAEDGRTADIISGGRLQLGISRGSPEQVIDGWRTFGYAPAEGEAATAAAGRSWPRGRRRTSPPAKRSHTGAFLNRCCKARSDAQGLAVEHHLPADLVHAKSARPYFGSMPAFAMTSVQRARSFASMCAVSAGWLAEGFMPCLSNSSITSGAVTAVAMASRSLCATAGGVPGVARIT